MGWGHGVRPDGKEVGYLVDATCEEPGCEKVIDRGLAYACGGVDSIDDGFCGGFFCEDHLYYSLWRRGQFCARCLKKFDDEGCGDDEAGKA